MHINVHFGIGVIIASMFHSFFHFTLFEFLMIIGCSFIMDFDIFFSKIAPDHNHRMLITHSIIPGIVLASIGSVIVWPALILSGAAYIIHSIIDTFDWGTNLLGFHKRPWGPKLLISKEELENLPAILARFKIKKSFFDFKYYGNKIILIFEGLVAFLMILFIIIFAFEYLLVVLLYIPLLFFHLSGFLHLKRIEKNKD
ncbi:MAG: hypothetical protein EU533_07920 [Promethearchaeota archaeon]|nr:MAG: hypothetical protein EU533_07920 [Candidatus Lokiarchaeota archaeon]